MQLKPLFLLLQTRCPRFPAPHDSMHTMQFVFLEQFCPHCPVYGEPASFSLNHTPFT